MGLRIGAGDVTISFLPLSHVDGAASGVCDLWAWREDCVLPKFDDLLGSDAGGEAADFPGGAAGVREDSAGDGSEVAWVQEEDFELGDGAGKETSQGDDGGEEPASPLWKLADKLVYSKLREAFGGRRRFMFREARRWGWIRRVVSGYGDSDFRGVRADGDFAGDLALIRTRLQDRDGGDGGAESRAAHGRDGEIEVRGTTVFTGYWGNEGDESEFTADGWFKTGDIGKVHGWISIDHGSEEGVDEDQQREVYCAAAD